MTVKELINYLKDFPQDMEVVDGCFDEIISVKQVTWEDTNYPYIKPDKQVCMIF